MMGQVDCYIRAELGIDPGELTDDEWVDLGGKALWLREQQFRHMERAMHVAVAKVFGGR